MYRYLVVLTLKLGTVESVQNSVWTCRVQFRSPQMQRRNLPPSVSERKKRVLVAVALFVQVAESPPIDCPRLEWRTVGLLVVGRALLVVTLVTKFPIDQNHQLRSLVGSGTPRNWKAVYPRPGCLLLNTLFLGSLPLCFLPLGSLPLGYGMWRMRASQRSLE